MMDTPTKLLDIVALKVDLPQFNLWRGQVGTIVEVLANGSAFEVEFSDRDGRTYESLGLRPEQIMVLRFDPVSPEEATFGDMFGEPISASQEEQQVVAGISISQKLPSEFKPFIAKLKSNGVSDTTINKALCELTGTFEQTDFKLTQ